MTKAFDKTAVGESFSQAAREYDAWALPQAFIAQRLARKLRPQWAPNSILDVGCGTGQMSALAIERYPKAVLHGIDIAPAMIDFCKARWRDDRRFSFELIDADALEETFRWDLIISNCALQWVRDPLLLFIELAEELRPGGHLAFAVPVAGTLCELDASHRAATGRPLPGPVMRPGSLYSRILRQTGFSITIRESPAHFFTYPNPLDVIRSLQKIGATFRNQSDYIALDPPQMRKLISYYRDNFSVENEGVAATYKTLYIIAEKQA